jgi:hypothetical protein
MPEDEVTALLTMADDEPHAANAPGSTFKNEKHGSIPAGDGPGS